MARKDLTFRVFVSSTFSDFIRERNALQQIVFPRLREACQQRGASFQAIDLRWGVAHEATLDQQTIRICIKELHRCRELSPKPNFIVLLGGRYGWIPLPPQIDTSEFEELRDTIINVDDRRLLWYDEDNPPTDRREGWYRKDENAVPTEYVLQPRTIDYAHEASDEVRRQTEQEATRDWQRIELNLHRVFQQAITKARWPADDPRRRKYERSATHQEIEHGALRVSDAKEHVFCYLRTIKGLPDDATAKTFRDLDEEGQPDPVAMKRLERLKQELEKATAENHRYPYSVVWETACEPATSGVVKKGDKLKPDSDLKGFCQCVESDLKQIIERELEDFQQRSELNRELGAHLEFARERSRHFFGRQDLFNKIADYIAENRLEPLVVHGRSGSGKTAILARSYLGHPKRVGEVRLVRLIGTTPRSSDLRSLLIGFCDQLSAEFSRDAEVPQQLNALVREFAVRLGWATATQPLVVYLDALDQLSAADNAHSLYWLPRKLPPHVKLIVSVLNDEGAGSACYDAACRMLRPRSFPESFIKMQVLSQSEGQAILDAWLRGAGRIQEPHEYPQISPEATRERRTHRRLTEKQRRHVLERIEACPWPLYLNLVFEEARRWKSYDDEKPLSGDIPGILIDLCERLEREQNHGRILTSRSLGYLVAARHGLSENELLDVLSTDEDVIRDARHRAPNSPSADHLPFVIWSQLFADLEPYMTQRDMNGMRLLAFYHRQVGESIALRYLDSDAKRQAHRHLADYFDRQDYARESRKQGHPGRGLNAPATGRSNVRKLVELPFHQAHAGLREALKRTLLNFDLIGGHIETFGVHSLLEDFGLIRISPVASQSLSADAELALASCEEAIRLAAPAIQVDPVQLSAQLVGRLPHDLPTLTDTIKQARALAKKPWLEPLTPSLSGPGGPLLFSASAHKARIAGIRSIAVTRDGNHIVCGGEDNKVTVWSMEHGTRIHTLTGHTDDVHSVAVSLDGDMAFSTSQDGTVRSWDLWSGVQLQQSAVWHGGGQKLVVNPKDGNVIAAFSDGTIFVLDRTTLTPIHVLDGHTFWVLTLFVFAEGTRLASGSDDGTVRIWDLEVGRQLHVFDFEKAAIRALWVSPDGSRAVIGLGDSDDTVLHVWNLETGDELLKLSGHRRRIQVLAGSRQGRMLLSGSVDDTIRLWDLEQGKEVARCDLETTVEAIVVAPGENYAVIADVTKLYRWSLEQPYVLRLIGVHEGQAIKAVAMTANGRKVVSGGTDGVLCAWAVDVPGDKEAPEISETPQINKATWNAGSTWMGQSGFLKMETPRDVFYISHAGNGRLALFFWRGGRFVFAL